VRLGILASAQGGKKSQSGEASVALSISFQRRGSI
jgi:hypothetical protein